MKQKNISRIIVTLLMVVMIAGSAFSLTTRDTSRIDASKDTSVVDTVTDTIDDTTDNSDAQNDDSNDQTTEDTPPIDDGIQDINDDPTDDNTDDDDVPNQLNLDPIVINDVIDVPIDTLDPTDDSTENEETKEIIEKPINKTLRTKPESTNQEKAEDSSVLTVEEIVEYKQELSIEGDSLELKIARKLIRQKRENQETYNDILSIVKESRTEKRELIASELADMNDAFVAKLRKQGQNNNVEQQIKDYTDSLQQEKPISITFDISMIKDVFNNEKSFDEIMAEFD